MLYQQRVVDGHEQVFDIWPEQPAMLRWQTVLG